MPCFPFFRHRMVIQPTSSTFNTNADPSLISFNQQEDALPLRSALRQPAPTFTTFQGERRKPLHRSTSCTNLYSLQEDNNENTPQYRRIFNEFPLAGSSFKPIAPACPTRPFNFKNNQPIPPPRSSSIDGRIMRNEACQLNLDPAKYYVRKIISHEAPPLFVVLEKPKEGIFSPASFRRPTLTPTSCGTPRVRFQIGKDEEFNPNLTRVYFV